MSGRAATTSIIEGECALSVGDPGTPVPEGWVRVPLLSIAKLGTGHTPSRSQPDYWNGDVPWIAIPDARDHHTRLITDTTETISQLGLNNSAARILPANTVGLSRTASVGYVFIMGRPMATSQDFVTWTCSDALDPRFLMYALLAEGDGIRRFGKGSTHTTIYFPEVKAFHLALAPKPEQNRIIAMLDSLRARSTRARQELDRIPILIERYKQAILAKAFSGELTADWRALHGRTLRTSYSDSSIDGRIASELPELPEAWSWASVDQTAVVTGGLTKNSKRSEIPTKAKYLRVANVYANELRLDDITEIGCTTAELSKTRLADGDLLIVEGNGSLDQIGRVALWSGQISDCSHQNHIIRARPLPSTIPKYGLYWLLSPIGRTAIERVASSSSGLHTLSISKVSALPIPMCIEEEQAEIVRRIDLAFAWLDKITIEHARADHLLPMLDQSILAKAFRGELVPQDPNDEPACALLEGIKLERARSLSLGRRSET